MDASLAVGPYTLTRVNKCDLCQFDTSNEANPLYEIVEGRRKFFVHKDCFVNWYKLESSHKNCQFILDIPAYSTESAPLSKGDEQRCKLIKQIFFIAAISVLIFYECYALYMFRSMVISLDSSSKIDSPLKVSVVWIIQVILASGLISLVACLCKKCLSVDHN